MARRVKDGGRGLHVILVRAAKQLAAVPFAAVTYEIRSGLAQGLRRRGGLGFLARPAALTREERFLAAMPLAGKTVYDIGSLEGMYALFLSRAVGDTGQVVAFEPNPRNARQIRRNLDANRMTNVRVCGFGLGAAEARTTMVVPFGLPGRGTVNGDLGAEYGRRAFSRTFPAVIRRLDEARRDERLPPPSLLKIDVEGHELEVLRGARATLLECRPALFVEIHGLTPEDRGALARAVMAFVREAGYSVVRHVETDSLIASPDRVTTFDGHLWCA